MSKLKITRFVCWVLAILCLVSTAAVSVSAADPSSLVGSTTNKTIKDYEDELNTIPYQAYMERNSAFFLNYKEAADKSVTFDTTSNWVFRNKSGNIVIELDNGTWKMTVTSKNPETGENVKTVYNSVEEAVAAGYEKKELVYVDNTSFGEKPAIYTPSIGSVTWTLDLASKGITEGLYSIELLYYPVVGKSASIEREFYINGDAPFSEARALTLAKIWSSLKADGTGKLTATHKLGKKESAADLVAEAIAAGLVCHANEDGTAIIVERPDVMTEEKNAFIDKYELRFFVTDADNNELRPTMVQTPEWTSYTLRDSEGFYSNNFGFVLAPDENGEIELTLEGVNEAMALSGIVIKSYDEVWDYATYLQHITNKVGNTNPGTGIVKLEGEYTTNTSTNVVYPVQDNTSALTSPADTTRIVLNTIGTEKWQTAGQWVEYKFTVNGSGMYEIYSRYKQSYLDGMYVCRELQLFTSYGQDEAAYVAQFGNNAGFYNGVPFAEASKLRFDYGTDWKVSPLFTGIDQNASYQVYLEAGVEYTLHLEVTLGSMSEKVRQIEDILDNLNNDYLSIIKLTGTSPDDYRDYAFNRLLPDTLINMMDQVEELQEVSRFLKDTADVASTYSGTCDKLEQLLTKMAKDEDEIARNLDNFKSYVGNLGTFLTDAKTQPLQIDYIMIQPSTAEPPKAAANFFQSFAHEFSNFLQSFFRDYNSMGSMDNGETSTSINVWLAYGRDQSQVIRSLCTNKFTPQTGISVDLKLVSGGTLLPSILAGMGPDVYLGLADATVINYAIRGALINVEEKEGFNEIVKECFTHAAMIQLEIADADGDVHTYGLPETQAFQMMFVRLDILAELGIEIPKTWDEVYTAQSKLESNNMEIGLNTNYKIFLYQSEGDLYADDGMRINLDSPEGLLAFETMCNLFTQKSFPYTYNAANRFRTGEMPIILADYTGLYNQLKVFATEIDGAWTFVPVPGTVQTDEKGNKIYDENGNPVVNNTADSTINAVVMISGIQNEDAAWEYMKWYTGAECQSEYANEMVAIIGDSAKHPTANRVALEDLPWTYEEYEEVAKQFENLAAIPNYPGSYYLDRHTNFAFLSAYNDNADPRTEILAYINTINKEITRKRQEFGLETLADGQTLEEKRLNQAMNAIDILLENFVPQDSTKYQKAIEDTKYGVANRDPIQLDIAAAEFAELLAADWNGEMITVTKVNGKTVEMPSYYVNVGKQTSDAKLGGYRIDSLNEQQLVYFISECLKDAAAAHRSYE